MKRMLTVGAVAAAAMIGVSAEAQAAAAPRVVGTWKVKQTITKHVVFPKDVGTTGFHTYSYQPQCGAGSCATVFIRTRADGTHAKLTLNPTSATQYKGTTKYIDKCVDANGNVLTPRGYNATETDVLTVTKSARGTATAFTSTIRIVFSPTAEGVRKNCRNDVVEAKAVSVQRLK